MTAPGDGFGESARDDEGKQPPAGGGPSQQPRPTPPWEPPTPPWEPPAHEVPPPAYPPPDYSAGHQAGYPAQYPPPGYQQPPGYEQPPGYGGRPYQPGPPQFGGPPPGYGPPGYPGGYYSGPYAGPDYPARYEGGYGPQGPMQSGTNALAIASLVTSFTGILCCIGSIAAIVLGATAIGQIKRTRQEGYGLAVAGIVIGVATLVVTLIVAIFALHAR
jgi:uncharacterized protein DUF4190